MGQGRVIVLLHFLRSVCCRLCGNAMVEAEAETVVTWLLLKIVLPSVVGIGGALWCLQRQFDKIEYQELPGSATRNFGILHNPFY